MSKLEISKRDGAKPREIGVQSNVLEPHGLTEA